MRSMTGFGCGEVPHAQGRLVVEIRSLNHRYVDVRVRVPEQLSEQAFFVEQLARNSLGRGRFDVGVRSYGEPLAPPRLSKERARAVLGDLLQLRAELAPESTVDLSVLTQLPGLLINDDATDQERLRESLQKAFSLARQELDDMRRREGDFLGEELGRHLAEARVIVERCELRMRETVPAHRERLRERVERLLGDASAVDPQRLELELVLVAERADATEELSRLSSHFAQFSSILLQDAPAGRKLDFLLQEISRETNTLGAKSQDAELSHLVVELKTVAERMREQVQNVE